MVEWLAPAKLSYACSANFLDHVDVLNLTTEQQSLLDQLPDPVFKESVRDFMVNQQFRKDYWVKGPRKLSALEQAESLRKKKVLLRTHRPDVSLTVKGALGEANMSEAIYAPLLDLLADHKARSLGQIEQSLLGRVGFVQLLQAIMVLTGAGHVVPVQEDSLISKAKKHCDKLNAHLINKARSGGEMSYLASPVTGGGVPVGRFPQLFLLALAQGKKHPLDIAKMVWEILGGQGQKLVKGGVTLNTAEENIEELTVQAQTFIEKQLPILKALQIA